MPAVARDARVDRILRPVHRWVWGDFDRRVRKLLAFAEVEGDGGRDILRAAELTSDPLLRRLYLEHAIDELRHADLFRQRGAALLQLRPTRSKVLFNTSPLPGGHGLDDLSIEGEPDHRLLAFLHVAEKAAAGRFAIYRDVVGDDPSTRASRLWKRYLRAAAALAGLLGTLILRIQYFILLPPFAWLAKRAERREQPGWTPIPRDRNDSPTRQY